jgi:hypothetical protein
LTGSSSLKFPCEKKIKAFAGDLLPSPTFQTPSV